MRMNLVPLEPGRPADLSVILRLLCPDGSAVLPWWGHRQRVLAVYGVTGAAYVIAWIEDGYHRAKKVHYMKHCYAFCEATANFNLIEAAKAMAKGLYVVDGRKGLPANRYQTT